MKPSFMLRSLVPEGRLKPASRFQSSLRDFNPSCERLPGVLKRRAIIRRPSAGDSPG